MNSFSHSFGESTYHFWWIAKYRYKMFGKRENKCICRDILMQVAERHGIKIHSLGIGDDHINVVVTIPPTMPVCKAFQLLKGCSSWALFRAIPNFRLRYPRGSLWGIGYGFRSIGDVDTDTVIAYVNRHNQMEITEFLSQNSAGFSPQ